MPSWKKMAEAFGRAMNERAGKDNHTRFTINSSKTARRANDPRHDFDDNFGDTPESAAYSIGQFHGNENFSVGHDQARESAGTAFPRSSDVSRRISRIEDKNSDARLAKDFEDAFNEVVDRHSTKVPDDAKRIYDNYNFDFERAYGPDDAYKRAVKKSKVEDAPASAGDFEERFGFDISDEMPSDNSDEVRAKMIEELKSGIDLSDFFEKYRK